MRNFDHLNSRQLELVAKRLEIAAFSLYAKAIACQTFGEHQKAFALTKLAFKCMEKANRFYSLAANKAWWEGFFKYVPKVNSKYYFSIRSVRSTPAALNKAWSYTE